MGLFLRFRFWLSRLRYRFSAWRFKRREDHENFLIAAQQKQISHLSSGWDLESAKLHQQISAMITKFEHEKRELELALRMAITERDQLDEVVARDRARVAEETALFTRREQEHKYSVETITKKPS